MSARRPSGRVRGAPLRTRTLTASATRGTRALHARCTRAADCLYSYIGIPPCARFCRLPWPTCSALHLAATGRRAASGRPSRDSSAISSPVPSRCVNRRERALPFARELFLSFLSSERARRAHTNGFLWYAAGRDGGRRSSVCDTCVPAARRLDSGRQCYTYDRWGRRACNARDAILVRPISRVRHCRIGHDRDVRLAIGSTFMSACSMLSNKKTLHPSSLSSEPSDSPLSPVYRTIATRTVIPFRV